jgi:hypothetical protein
MIIQGFTPPKWAFELEKQIMGPARDRLVAAHRELEAAVAWEQECFHRFQAEYKARLEENESSA